MKHYLAWDHTGIWKTLIQAEDAEHAIRLMKEGEAIAPMVQELVAFCHQKNINQEHDDWLTVAYKQTVRYDNSAQPNRAHP